MDLDSKCFKSRFFASEIFVMLVATIVIEWSGYETRQSSSLYVFVRFFFLTLHKT